MIRAGRGLRNQQLSPRSSRNKFRQSQHVWENLVQRGEYHCAEQWNRLRSAWPASSRSHFGWPQDPAICIEVCLLSANGKGFQHLRKRLTLTHLSVIGEQL